MTTRYLERRVCYRNRGLVQAWAGFMSGQACEQLCASVCGMVLSISRSPTYIPEVVKMITGLLLDTVFFFGGSPAS